MHQQLDCNNYQLQLPYHLLIMELLDYKYKDNALLFKDSEGFTQAGS